MLEGMHVGSEVQNIVVMVGDEVLVYLEVRSQM